MLNISISRKLNIVYKNYHGEISKRSIAPKSIRFGFSEWHTEPQWLMTAYDYEKNEMREFAMRDMSSVEEE